MRIEFVAVDNTPSVPNYRSFDFFDTKFDHLSYLKNLCEYYQI